MRYYQARYILHLKGSKKYQYILIKFSIHSNVYQNIPKYVNNPEIQEAKLDIINTLTHPIQDPCGNRELDPIRPCRIYRILKSTPAKYTFSSSVHRTFYRNRSCVRQ
jgi:hypothetical protein